MSKSKSRFIGDVFFEYTKRAKDSVAWYYRNYAMRELYDAYKNPSKIKWAIYHEWADRFYTMNTDNFKLLAWGITGANAMTFSLGAVFRDSDGVEWYFWITKEHNYFWSATA